MSISVSMLWRRVRRALSTGFLSSAIFPLPYGIHVIIRIPNEDGTKRLIRMQGMADPQDLTAAACWELEARRQGGQDFSWDPSRVQP